MTLSMPRKSGLVQVVARTCLVVAGLIFAAWLPANLAMPLGRDQGIFGWAGQVVLAGGLPYVDAWEVKGPAAHYLYALGMAVFGESRLGIRLFDTALLAGLTLGLLWFARRHYGRTLWGWVTALFVFIFYGGSYWHTAQVDGWVSYGVMLAILLLWHEPTRLSPVAAVVVGLLLALAVLVKPNFALLAPLPLLAYAWRAADGRRPRANIGWCMLGGAVPILACLLMYGLRGQLHTVWDVLVAFNIESHLTLRKVTWARLPFILAQALIAPLENTLSLWLLHILAVIGSVDLWRRDRRGAVLLIVGWVCGWAVGVTQNKGFYYHFAPMYVCAAALAAHAVVQVVSGTAGDRWSRARDGFVAVLLFLLLPVLQSLEQAKKFWGYQLGLHTAQRYEANFCDGGFCDRDNISTAAFLREHTKPGETIYVWGFDALLHLMADRASPTRYGFNYAMTVGSPRYAEAAKAEVMAALAARPPAAIIVQEFDTANIKLQTSRKQLAQFPALRTLIDRDYRRAFGNGHFTVYLRRTP